MFNSLTEEQGVQKNMKIQYLKGALRFILSQGLYSSTLLFVLIYRLWLILVFPVCLWEQGFVVTPLTDWLPSFHFSLSEETPCLFRRRKGRICPENVPPATLTPRGHGNIHTGEHYRLRLPYYVPSLLQESDSTYMQKIKQLSWIQMWNFV